MLLNIQDVYNGSSYQGGVYDYYIKVELPASKRKIKIFWATSKFGDKLKNLRGKCMEGVLFLTLGKILPYPCADDEDSLLHPLINGCVHNEIDLQSEFINEEIQYKSPPAYLDIYGLETEDGRFYFGSRPNNEGVFKDGDQICFKPGRIDLLTWIEKEC